MSVYSTSTDYTSPKYMILEQLTIRNLSMSVYCTFTCQCQSRMRLFAAQNRTKACHGRRLIYAPRCVFLHTHIHTHTHTHIILSVNSEGTTENDDDDGETSSKVSGTAKVYLNVLVCLSLCVCVCVNKYYMYTHIHTNSYVHTYTTSIYET